MKKYFLILTIFIMALTTSACSFNKSTLSKPDIYKLNQKAAEYMAAGDYDSAIARLESINDLDPTHPEVQYNLGVAYIKKEDYEEAVKALSDAVKLKSDFAEAYYSLGVAYEALCDEQIEDFKEEKDAKEKAELAAQIPQNIQNTYDSYNMFLEKAPDSPEKETVRSQLNFLGEKYKDFVAPNKTTIGE